MGNSIITSFGCTIFGYVVFSLFWRPRYIDFYFIIISLSKMTPLFPQLMNKSVLECKLTDSLFVSIYDCCFFCFPLRFLLILINLLFFSESYQNNCFSSFPLCLSIKATQIWPGLEKATISGWTTDDCWFWISHLQIQQFLRFNLTTVNQQRESPCHNAKMIVPFGDISATQIWHADSSCLSRLTWMLHSTRKDKLAYSGVKAIMQ